MKYSTLINALAAMVGSNARTSTRTNYPKEEDALGHPGITFDLTRMEVSATGYDAGQLGFTLRAMEISNETVVPTKEKALQMVSENDSQFKQFFDDESNSTLLDISGALAYAGMSNNYFRVLRDVHTIVESYSDKHRGPTLLGATKQLVDGCVAFFVQLENSAVIIQVKP